MQFITSTSIYKQDNNNYHSRNINCIHRQVQEAQVTAPFSVQSNRQGYCFRNWPDWRRPSSCSSPPSPTPSSLPSSLPSTRVSQEFNDWYHRLRIHSVYDFEVDASLKTSSSLKDWVRHQPLAVLHLDPVDRIVLKIAGQKIPLISMHPCIRCFRRFFFLGTVVHYYYFTIHKVKSFPSSLSGA